MKLLTLLFAGAAALAPTPAKKHIKAAKPAALPYQVAAAATAFAPLAALAGGQAEGTGLALGIEDVREGYALLGMAGSCSRSSSAGARSSPTRTATSSASTTSAASRVTM